MFFFLLKFSSFLYCSQIIVLQKKNYGILNLDAFRRYSRGRSKILRTKTSKINSFITAICGEMEVRSLLRVDHTFFIFLFRLILLLMTVLTILFTWLWLNDPNTSNTTLFTSLKAHPFFLLRFVTITVALNITKIITLNF